MVVVVEDAVERGREIGKGLGKECVFIHEPMGLFDDDDDDDDDGYNDMDMSKRAKKTCGRLTASPWSRHPRAKKHTRTHVCAVVSNS
jgi:hypothetical protein